MGRFYAVILLLTTASVDSFGQSAFNTGDLLPAIGMGFGISGYSAPTGAPLDPFLFTLEYGFLKCLSVGTLVGNVPRKSDTLAQTSYGMLALRGAFHSGMMTRIFDFYIGLSMGFVVANYHNQGGSWRDDAPSSACEVSTLNEGFIGCRVFFFRRLNVTAEAGGGIRSIPFRVSLGYCFNVFE